MSLPGQRAARTHLRIANSPPATVPRPGRALLVARVVVAQVQIVLVNAVALMGALLNLAPLLFRRRPLGHRTHLPRQVARIISIDQGRRTVRRSC